MPDRRKPPAAAVCRTDAIDLLALTPALFDALVARGDIPRRPDGRFDRLELERLRAHWSSRPNDDGDDT